MVQLSQWTHSTELPGVCELLDRSQRRLTGWLAAVDELKARLVRDLSIHQNGPDDDCSRQLWSLVQRPGLPGLHNARIPLAFLDMQPKGPVLRPSLTELVIDIHDDDDQLARIIDLAIVVPQHFDMGNLKLLSLDMPIFDNPLAVSWIRSLAPLECLNLYALLDEGNINVAELVAILRHHGKTLGSLLIEGTFPAQVEPKFPSLSTLCPLLDVLTFHVTVDDNQPEASSPVAHALAGGHPRLSELQIYNGWHRSSSPEDLCNVEVDFAEAEARSVATVLHNMLLADRSLFPALQVVVFSGLEIPLFRIETFNVVLALYNLGLSVYIGHGQSPWMKPAGADCPLFAPFLLYPSA